MIKKFKPAYWLYNLFQRSALKHNIPLYKKYGINKTYFDSISSENFKHLESSKNKYDALDSFEHIIHEEAFTQLDSTYQNALRTWSRDGYVILKNFFTEAQIQAVNAEVQSLISAKKVAFRYQEKKIMFAFHLSKLIRGIGENKQLRNILKLLMGKEVELFQSINFINASEQKTHSDSIHMTTFPLGNMIAVWIALEDVTEENGPLHYYPGSHKLPYVMNRDFGNVGNRFFLGDKAYSDYEDKIEQIVEAHQLEKKVFLANKGDLLIWHANLLHGGNPLLNEELTRKSMVFHYYSKDAICYHELTQRPSLKLH